MIAPSSNADPSVVHIVAPPSMRQGQANPIGRSIPTMLLKGAIENALTPPPPNARIITIGDSTTRRSAQALGVHISNHNAPLLGKPNTLKRRIINDLKTAQPSRIICWSDELLNLSSAVASAMDVPLELISTKPTLLSKPPQNIDTIRVFENQDHDRWQDLRHTCQTDQFLAQHIDPQQPEHSDRSQARIKLGIEDDTIVIAAVADNPSHVDAREFAFLLGLLAVSGYSTLGIIPNTAQNLNQALRHHRGLDQPFRIMTTSQTLPQILPLLDAYIHPTDEISGSTQLLDRYLERAGIHKLNLRHAGKAGFSRAQGTAGQLLDEMDDIIEHMKERMTSHV